MRTVLGQVRSATLVDIALADDLKSRPNVTAIEGNASRCPSGRCPISHST